MAGTIALSPDVRWLAASWLFDWVLESIADALRDNELETEIREIVQENLEWFDLEDLSTEQSGAVRSIIGEQIRPLADNVFPTNMLGREEALQHLDRLIRLASDTPES